MTPSTYLVMKKTPLHRMYSQFHKHYAYEHGEKKAKEIAEKVASSEKVNHYLDGLLRTNTKPTPTGLQILMNTIPYFMLSKAETLCLGGLNVMYSWWMRTEPDLDSLDDTKDSVISTDFILACSNTKTHVGENFFSRFFKEVDKANVIE